MNPHQARQRKFGELITGTAIAASLALTTPAHSADEEKEDDNLVDEIIVTANKRAESIQDVPLAVAAFSDAQIERSDISDLLDIIRYSPSVEVTPSQSGGGTFSIRGVSTGIGGPGVDPNIALYWNGVYVARDFVAFQDFLDIERVEILRGPQGTLYGRNATGGAINVITKKPGNEFEVEFRAEVGEFDRRGLASAVSIPLVEDTLAVRLSASRQQEDSYSINLLDDERIKRVDSTSAAATLLYEPTDSVAFTLRADYEEDDGAGVYSQHLIDTGPPGFGSNFGAVLTTDPFQFRHDFSQNEAFLKHWGVTGDVVWDINGYQLKAITGFRHIENRILFDSDGSEVPAAFYDNIDESDAFSQEIQLTSPPDEAFDWIAGLYYFEEDASNVSSNGAPTSVSLFTGLSDPLTSAFINVDFPFSDRSFFDSENSTKAYALYGEVRFELVDRVRVTAGLRYNKETKDFDSFVRRVFSPIEGSSLTLEGQSVDDVCQGLIDDGAVSLFNPTDPFGECSGLMPVIGVPFNLRTQVDFFQAFDNSIQRPSEKADFDALTPRVVVEYRPNDAVLAYVSATGGFKSGGFNSFDTNPIIVDANGDGVVDANDTGLIPFQPPFDEEELLSYEVGVKTNIGERSTLNIGAFFYDYSDIQVQVFDNLERTTFVTNNAEAEIYGIEVDAIIAPTDTMSIDFAGAWTDSEYTDFGTPVADTVTGDLTDFTGVEIPGNSSWKHNLGIQQTMYLDQNRGGSLTFRGEWQRRGNSQFGLSLDNRVYGGKYDIANVGVTYQTPEGKYRVALFVRNLTDKVYDITRFGNELFGTQRLLGAPRTWMLSFSGTL